MVAIVLDVQKEEVRVRDGELRQLITASLETTGITVVQEIRGSGSPLHPDAKYGLAPLRLVAPHAVTWVTPFSDQA